MQNLCGVRRQAYTAVIKLHSLPALTHVLIFVLALMMLICFMLISRVRGEFPLHLSTSHCTPYISTSEIERDWLECSAPITCLSEHKAKYAAVLPEQQQLQQQSSSNGNVEHKADAQSTTQPALPAAMPACTLFRRVCYDGHTSLILCRPITGRTHQIRIHLQFMGYPIANDHGITCNSISISGCNTHSMQVMLASHSL